MSGHTGCKYCGWYGLDANLGICCCRGTGKHHFKHGEVRFTSGIGMKCPSCGDDLRNPSSSCTFEISVGGLTGRCRYCGEIISDKSEENQVRNTINSRKV